MSEDNPRTSDAIATYGAAASRSLKQHSRRLRRWQLVQAFGGLILASAFFLPAVDGCSAPVIPSETVMETWRETGTGIDEWLARFVVYIAAYLFGLFSCLVALRQWCRPNTPSGDQGVSVAVLFGVVAATFVVFLLRDLGQGTPVLLEGAIFVVLLFVSCAYWFRSIRTGSAGLLSVRWYAATCCLVWFGWWLFYGRTYYGLWLSIAGSLLLAVACVGEAGARSCSSFLSALWKLVTCRLRLFDLDEQRCVKCGYLLIGLTLPRCPECGLPFDWNDRGIEPAVPSPDGR